MESVGGNYKETSYGRTITLIDTGKIPSKFKEKVKQVL